MSHDARPQFAKATPVHVTLGTVEGLQSLRNRRSWQCIERCFQAARERLGMRLIEFSVLGDHVHLVVEADSSEALSRGMNGLTVRLARALNAMMRRKGALFADHYHSRLVRTPTDLVHTIRYVLDNAKRHFGLTGPDPFSSEVQPRSLLARGRSWLVRVGWRLAKAAPLSQAPGAA